MPEYHRIGELFRAGRARILQGDVQFLATLALVAFVAIAYFLVPVTPGEENVSSDLFPNRTLTAYQLERMEAALGQAQLSDYTVRGGRLYAPANMRSKYLSAISEASALPESFHAPTEAAIAQTSMMESSRQQSQRLHHASQKEARLLICALPGVLDASVHFDETHDGSLYRRTQLTAVVGIQTSPEVPLDEQRFRTIQAMLLNFKAGLRPESITITDLTTGRYFRGSVDQPSLALTQLRQADLERKWNERLRSAIAFLPEVQVTVHVVPNAEGTEADAVRCSISVPLDRVPLSPSEIATQSNLPAIEQDLRRKICNAIQPLLPRASESIDQRIAVTVFERDGSLGTESQASRDGISLHGLVSPNLLAVALIGIAGIMAAMLIRNPDRMPTRRTDGESDGGLRIFDGSGDPHPEPGSADELQQLAEQDPRSVADSLTQFIDRAGSEPA